MTAGAVGPVVTAALAGGSLVVGFAVAQLTGVRALGGFVLLAAVAWCALRWRRLAGTGTAVGLGVVYLVLFVAAHLLADALTAWAAVVLVAVAMSGASAWATGAARGGRETHAA